MRITHPEPGFNGSASGIEFENGTAEVESLSDTAQAVLSENGFTFDGESAPPSAPVVEDIEGATERADEAGWHVDDVICPSEPHDYDLIIKSFGVVAGVDVAFGETPDGSIGEAIAVADLVRKGGDVIAKPAENEEITTENAAVVEHENGVVETGTITEAPAEPARKGRFGRKGQA